MSVLFESVKMGDLELANRVVMAPLTRSRGTGTDNRVPNSLMATYYSQRANAGLIISEATAVTPMGVGYARTPGIWSDEQVDGWKKPPVPCTKRVARLCCSCGMWAAFLTRCF